MSQIDVYRGGERMNTYTVWQCLFLIWVESTDSIFSPESPDFIHHAELSDLRLARHTQPQINHGSSLFTISFCVIHSSPPAGHSHSQTLLLQLFSVSQIIFTAAFLSSTSQCLLFHPLRSPRDPSSILTRPQFSPHFADILLLYLLQKFNMHRMLLLFVSHRCIIRDADNAALLRQFIQRKASMRNFSNKCDQKTWKFVLFHTNRMEQTQTVNSSLDQNLYSVKRTCKLTLQLYKMPFRCRFYCFDLRFIRQIPNPRYIYLFLNLKC